MIGGKPPESAAYPPYLYTVNCWDTTITIQLVAQFIWMTSNVVALKNAFNTGEFILCLNLCLIWCCLCAHKFQFFLLTISNPQHSTLTRIILGCKWRDENISYIYVSVVLLICAHFIIYYSFTFFLLIILILTARLEWLHSSLYLSGLEVSVQLLWLIQYKGPSWCSVLFPSHVSSNMFGEVGQHLTHSLFRGLNFTKLPPGKFNGSGGRSASSILQ